MKDQDGASIVEFAIIFPLLMLLLFGIIELSLLLYNQQILTNAAREGARLGIIAQPTRVTDQQIKDKIKEKAKNYLVTFGTDTLEDIDIDILPSGRCLLFGCDLKVEVTYKYNYLILAIPIFGGFGPTTLTAISVMRME